MRTIVVAVAALAAIASWLLFFSHGGAPGDASAPAARPIARTISAGERYVLAIDDVGRIFGWGWNGRGQLATPSACELPIPKLVSDAQPWRSVHAGSEASYAIAADGALWRRPFVFGVAQGENGCAQRRAPLPYEPLNWESRWIKVQEAWLIAGGIDTAGALWFWNDDEIVPEAARDVGGVARAALVAAGPKAKWRDFCLAINKAYAIADDGTLYTDTITAKPHERVRAQQFASLVAVPAPAEARLRRVFCRANASHVLALDEQGALWGMGPNDFGELGNGDGDRFTKNEPVTVLTRVTKPRWRDIAVGAGYTVGVAADGSLWGWGNNAHAQLGSGNYDYSDVPRLIDRERRWVAVQAGNRFALGMTDDAAVFAWGENENGVLGEGGSARAHTTPARVYGEEQWMVQDAIQ